MGHSVLYKQWRFIFISSWIVVLAGCLPAILPIYSALLVSRCVQGFLSAFFWSYMSIASNLRPVAGIEANAVALTGASLGELTGT
jgi:predicted MFS family arabinose efflux permease